MLQAGMSQTAIAETVRTTQETITIGFTGVRPPASEDLKLPPPPQGETVKSVCSICKTDF